MDYEIPESLRLMQDTIRRFVNQDLEPLSQQVEDEDHIPEAIVQKMRELGLFGLSIPEEYGGLDLGTFGECLVYEELTKTNAAFRSRIGTSSGSSSESPSPNSNPFRTCWPTWPPRFMPPGRCSTTPLRCGTRAGR
jgi:acyl-CoA dehydrogenase